MNYSFKEKYYKFKDYWWSKDVTGYGTNGTSAFKVYKQVGKTLVWVADAEQNGQFIEGKHKGEAGKRVDMKKMKKCDG